MHISYFQISDNFAELGQTSLEFCHSEEKIEGPEIVLRCLSSHVTSCCSTSSQMLRLTLQLAGQELQPPQQQQNWTSSNWAMSLTPLAQLAHDLQKIMLYVWYVNMLSYNVVQSLTTSYNVLQDVTSLSRLLSVLWAKLGLVLALPRWQWWALDLQWQGSDVEDMSSCV